MKFPDYTQMPETKVVIRKCHKCGKVMESCSEIQKCIHCNKSFLPLNYFSKIHGQNSSEFNELFSTAGDIYEDDVIKGVIVIW